MPKARRSQMSFRWGSAAQKASQLKAARASAEKRRLHRVASGPASKADRVELDAAQRGGTAKGQVPLSEAARLAQSHRFTADNKHADNKAAYAEAGRISKRLKATMGADAPSQDNIYSSAKKLHSYANGGLEDPRKAGNERQQNHNVPTGKKSAAARVKAKTTVPVEKKLSDAYYSERSMDPGLSPAERAAAKAELNRRQNARHNAAAERARLQAESDARHAARKSDPDLISGRSVKESLAKVDAKQAERDQKLKTVRGVVGANHDTGKAPKVTVTDDNKVTIEMAQGSTMGAVQERRIKIELAKKGYKDVTVKHSTGVGGANFNSSSMDAAMRGVRKVKQASWTKNLNDKELEDKVYETLKLKNENRGKPFSGTLDGFSLHAANLEDLVAEVRARKAGAASGATANKPSDGPQVRTHTAADIKVRDQLIKQASDSNITYSAKPGGRSAKIGRTTWHEVQAKSKDGRTWTYWLAKDQGSFKGSHMDRMPKGSLDLPKARAR